MTLVKFLLILIIMVITESRKIGPPTRTKDVETVIVYEGKSTKLVCPIYGEPQPIIEWEKDGEEIDYSWERIMTEGNYLAIKKVQSSDTGVYICRGVNGFGTEKAKLELVVAGKFAYNQNKSEY